MLLPLVDGLPVNRGAHLIEGLGDFGSAAELIDEGRCCCHDDRIIGTFFRLVKMDNLSDDFGATADQNSAMARDPKKTDKRDPYDIECGKRLILARTALGYPKRRPFARLTLDSATPEDARRAEDNLTKWENGYAGIPTWYVVKLKALFGITADYLYAGDLGSLKADLREKISAIAADQ